MRRKRAIRAFSAVLIVLVLGTAAALAHGTGLAGAASTSIFSGILTDQYNAPIASATIALANGPSGPVSTTSANDGSFSISATPGVYNLWVYGENVDGIRLMGPYAPDTIDLSNDLIQNLQLNIATIHVTVEDFNGNPISGVDVNAKGEGWTTYFPGYQVDALAWTPAPMVTDSNGQTEFNTLVGQTYVRGTNTGKYICATYQNSFICLKDDNLTVTGNTNVILRQDLPAPPNLVATSPTKTSVLSWGAVSGASSYNIYRDINEDPYSKIASTTSTSFSDTSIADGNYKYYVTSVNAIQESIGSNPVNVLVDNTNPIINYTLSRSPTAYGWINSAVTITFNCSDTGSGIATCSSPVIMSGEGSNQTVTGTALDNTGNTSSITSVVSIDLTSPSTSNLQLALNKKTSTLSVAANAIDMLSGVSRGEFYIDTDPGTGNGMAMTYSNGQLAAQVNSGVVGKGQHTIFVRAQDKAGNWGAVVAGTIRI